MSFALGIALAALEGHYEGRGKLTTLQLRRYQRIVDTYTKTEIAADNLAKLLASDGSPVEQAVLRLLDYKERGNAEQWEQTRLKEYRRAAAEIINFLEGK